MTTATKPAGVDLDGLGEELTRNVMFVSVTVHMWRGQRKIEQARVQVGDADLAVDLRTDPRWKLMPRVWASRFTEIEGKVRGLVDSYSPRNSESVSLPLRGIDIVPRKSAGEFFQKLKSIEEVQFKPLVNRFCDAWPTLVAELRDRILAEGKPDVWETAAKMLPDSPAAVKSKFRIEKRVVPISFDTKIEVLDGDEAEEFVDEVQQGIAQFKHQAAAAIVSGLQAELNEAVDNLIGRIQGKGVIKGGTIGMVRAAFDKLQSFSFAATSEVKAKILAVRAQLDGLDCTELNKDIKHESGAIASKLAGALKDLRAQTAEEAKALRGFGKRARALEV